LNPRGLSRQASLLWGASSLAVALLAIWPGVSPLLRALPACPFRLLTGWPCLACGSGRALAALSRGELGAALELNPLAVGGALLFGLGGLVAALAALCERPLGEPRTLAAGARVAVGVLLVANWAYLVWSGR
jgi:hypothetical protein